MLSKNYFFIFLVSNAMRSGSTVFKNYYGIKTDEHPKESCHRIDNIRSKGQCLATCEIKVERIVMISHDESSNTCMCCNDIKGSDITGPYWKSYVPRRLPCANGYASYYLMPYQICLKYFQGPVSYSTAKTKCQAEGADLIKIDSQEKYGIFKDYHGPIGKNVDIQVWVQGEKVGDQWQFDDGTPMPNICPINIAGENADQVHMRAKSSNSFNCSDAENARLYNYSCEYHFISSFNN